MGFVVEEKPRIQQHFARLEHRPMLLKDFLRDDVVSNKPHIVLLRSWSRRAAATKISAVHKVIKLLHFASSRNLTHKRSNCDRSASEVKVKDILRWRSFRDLPEEDAPIPFIFSPSPHRTTASCSKTSSWCDTDFTAEELPPWRGENEELSTFKNPKEDWSTFEDYEQQSPVSVLDSPFRQVQEFTHFHPILQNIPRAKCDLTRRTQERSLEGEIAIYEERARKLLSQVGDDDDVMMDFFVDELSRNGNHKLGDEEFECEILRIAKSWMDGELEESYEWEVEEERASFLKDMERGICWNKFEDEREELCKELEVWVLNDLLDDLVADLLS